MKYLPSILYLILSRGIIYKSKITLFVPLGSSNFSQGRMSVRFASCVVSVLTPSFLCHAKANILGRSELNPGVNFRYRVT